MKKNLLLLIFLTFFTFSVPAQNSPAGIEAEILNEINKVRANPSVYLTELEEYKKLFEGKKVNVEGRLVDTYDGVAAVDEAIKFLKSANPLEPLTHSEGLTKAAQQQVEELKENTSLGIVGKDGTTIPKRAGKFGKGGKLYAANINIYAQTAKDAVLNMLIDDGIKGRGNRKNIFNKNLRYAGISFSRGKNEEPITLIIFADKFIEKTN